MKKQRGSGFSIIELLLALAIIGIVAGIAIPALYGARTRARRIGDAEANSRIIAMMLETRRSEAGTYGPEGVYTYNMDGSFSGGSNIIPAFKAKGNSTMNYQITIAAGGLTYKLVSTEAGSSTKYFEIDETGAVLYKHR